MFSFQHTQYRCPARNGVDTSKDAQSVPTFADDRMGIAQRFSIVAALIA